MGKYDGPSFYKKDHPKIEPITGESKAKKRSKYQLPEAVQTRDELKQEAHRVMKTPARMTRRFRSTKIPNSLQHLDGWKSSRRNHQLIQAISERLDKEPAEYLLFEEYMKEAPEPDSNHEPDPEPEGVTLVKKELVNLQFGDKKPAKKKPVQKKTAASKEKKAEAVQEKMKAAKLKPNSGLHRSLSTIIADDEKAMKQWNSNLDSLFSDEKNSKK